MSSNLIGALAEKSGKSEKEVENLWNEAKSQVEEQYPDVSEKSPRYYKLVVGVLKNMLGLK